MTDREPSSLDAALRYLGLGWNIIPVTINKHPRLDKWEEYQRRRVTEEEVRAWWTRWPDAGIAIITGAISGVVVVDVDSEEGLAALKPYLKAGDTLTATTGRGGKHFYFKHPGGIVPCVVRLLPSVDVRGDGGYVVAPPSRHRSGRRYAWEDPSVALSLLPPSLMALTLARSPSRRLEPRDWQTDIMDGERDQELTRRVGRLIQAGIPAGEALTMALAVNASHCKPPLPDAQVRKIVASIAAREATKPKPESATERCAVEWHDRALRRLGTGEDEEWLVDGWLPRAGCGLLVGSPKNFKTWLSLDLAIAVAAGGKPFLGQYPAKHGAVLIVQLEDPMRQLLGRVHRIYGAANDAPCAVGADAEYELELGPFKRLANNDFGTGWPIGWIRDFSLKDKEAVSALGHRIAEYQPALVIIDSLYIAAGGKSEDFFARTASEMHELKRMAEQYGCAFLVVHHTTWAGRASDDIASMWGSIFLFAWLDYGWMMMETADKKAGVVRLKRFFKDAEEPEVLKLTFRLADRGYAVTVGVDDKQSVSDRIEEAILTGGRFKNERDLAEAIKCTPGAAHKAIIKMGLEKNGEECYTIPRK